MHEQMRRNNLFGKFVIQSVSLNANLVKEDTIQMLKDIGVIRLGIGMESLNPRILKVMKRGVVTLEHIDKTIRYANRAGIPIGGSQVYGFPGETKEEMTDSILRVKHYENATIFRHWYCYVCQPLPGSQLWNDELIKGNVSLDMDFSSLRIDGDCRFFDTPWHYSNESNVPHGEFLSILKKYGILPRNFFIPPGSFNEEEKGALSKIGKIGKKLYHSLLFAIEGRKR